MVQNKLKTLAIRILTALENFKGNIKVKEAKFLFLVESEQNNDAWFVGVEKLQVWKIIDKPIDQVENNMYNKYMGATTKQFYETTPNMTRTNQSARFIRKKMRVFKKQNTIKNSKTIENNQITSEKLRDINLSKKTVIRSRAQTSDNVMSNKIQDQIRAKLSKSRLFNGPNHFISNSQNRLYGPNHYVQLPNGSVKNLSKIDFKDQGKGYI